MKFGFNRGSFDLDQVPYSARLASCSEIAEQPSFEDASTAA